MEFRRSTRGMTSVDENARVLGGRVNNGAMKRSLADSSAAAGGAVKGVMAARGLAVRKPAAATFDQVPPAAKQQRRTTAEATIVRPANGAVSKECEMITEDYVEDIAEYMLDSEEQYLVDELFMANKQVTPKMRSILADWIVQVHQRFHLLPETLFLTIYLIDRYLERHDVEKTQLQLVGVCAMLAASKYEETYCPELKDYEFITDSAYTKKQMLRMEIEMVKAASFDLGRAHSIQFLRSFSQRATATAPLHCLAKYLQEMALLDSAFSSMRPSLIAAGSLWLADSLKGTNLKLKDSFAGVPDKAFGKEAIEAGKLIAGCVLRIRHVGKLRAVTDKYGSSKMFNASKLNDAEESALEKIVLDHQKHN